MPLSSLKNKKHIEKGLFHTPFWLPPANEVFQERSTRFQELAQCENSEWQLYLQLLAKLSAAQHLVLSQYQFLLPTDVATGTVLPNVKLAKVPAEFYSVLTDLLMHVDKEIPNTVQVVLNNLAKLNPENAEQLAQRVLSNQHRDEDRSMLIWVRAALQVIWTAWAMQLSEDDVPPVEERILCPCCGTEAVGSLILIKGDLAGFRYMQCPHCNGRWNALRAKCLSCGSSSGMRIQEIDHNEGDALSPALVGARAESCENCYSYRKLYRLDKQQYADVVADDLASIALDILVDESGYQRGGANPFLLLSN